jgi:transposase InsO family protein
LPHTKKQLQLARLDNYRSINALAESFFSSLQVELLDRQSWATRQQLANAIFEWIEAWYNPTRRHSALDYLSPIDYERAHTPTATAA